MVIDFSEEVKANLSNLRSSFYSAITFSVDDNDTTSNQSISVVQYAILSEFVNQIRADVAKIRDHRQTYELAYVNDSLFQLNTSASETRRNRANLEYVIDRQHTFETFSV